MIAETQLEIEDEMAMRARSTTASAGAGEAPAEHVLRDLPAICAAAAAAEGCVIIELARKLGAARPRLVLVIERQSALQPGASPGATGASPQTPGASPEATDPPGSLPPPQGVTIEDCARVSRRLAASLEELDPFAGAWTLEVSSPGLDRKLADPVDFVRFRGRTARLELRSPRDGRRSLRGTIEGPGSRPGSVLLRDGGTPEPLEIDWAEVAAARLDFEVPGATRRAPAGARSRR